MFTSGNKISDLIKKMFGLPNQDWNELILSISQSNHWSAHQYITARDNGLKSIHLLYDHNYYDETSKRN